MQRLSPLAARTIENDGSGLEEELLLLRFLGHGARAPAQPRSSRALGELPWLSCCAPSGGQAPFATNRDAVTVLQRRSRDFLVHDSESSEHLLNIVDLDNTLLQIPGTVTF